MQGGVPVYIWWYEWGMFLFFLLDLVAIFWIFLDSASRRINALVWRIGSIVTTLLIMPSVFVRFSDWMNRPDLLDFVEPFFWLGLFGGLIPIVLAIIYAVVATARPSAPVAPPATPMPPPPRPVAVQPPSAAAQPPPVPPAKPKANGWVYVQSGPAAGSSFHLNIGDTRIGRSPDNDIVLSDPEVSKGHALVREQGGQFTIQDLGSTNGTFVNEQRLYSVQMLYDGDTIHMGQTLLVFKHIR